MIRRTYSKTVLIETLKESISETMPDLVNSIISSDTKVILTLSREPTTQEDIDLQDIVMANTPSDSFVDEKKLTDQRNAEGFILYKQIFAHISQNEPVQSIDGFIEISDTLHKLRNFLKDGNFETAVRYMYLNVQPVATGDNGLFPLGFETYREWIKDIARKYDSKMDLPMSVINPLTIGTPLENVTLVDYIEIAESI